jgi:dTDP-glucose 4,6-dehydratase
LTLIEKGQTNEIYNIAGDFEQENKETVRKIIQSFYGTDEDWENHIDYSYSRVGQDLRYALDDTKIKNLGWRPEKNFDEEIKSITQWYKDNFIW